MLAIVHSAATCGIDARVLDVEVDVSAGLPHFTIVGLPDASVREARERVRSALRNSGFPLPVHEEDPEPPRLDRWADGCASGHLGRTTLRPDGRRSGLRTP